MKKKEKKRKERNSRGRSRSCLVIGLFVSVIGLFGLFGFAD